MILTTQTMWTVILIVAASFVPMILAGQPPATMVWRRYLLALAAGVLGGLFMAYIAPLPKAAPPYVREFQVLRDTLAPPTLVLAVVAGTFLYGLGSLPFEMMSEAAPPGRQGPPKKRHARARKARGIQGGRIA